MNNENNHKWDFGFGMVCTWGVEVYTINFIPNIEYVHNSFNRGITFTLFGLGFFVGKVNTTLINEQQEAMNNSENE
jgi:hypothetical protein